MRPLSLDLVICTYNNAPLLAETLRAIARQKVSSATHWRVIVVDNNCTDGTPSVVARWAPEIPAPVETVYEKRQGLNPARVRGVSSGDSDWIAFVDDDCVLAPDWVEQAARFAQDHPEAGAFSGRVQLRWLEAAPAWVKGYGYAFAETDLGDAPHRRDWLAGAGMVLRREALEATGWLEQQFVDDRIGKRLISGGDVELGLRMAARFQVWYAPGCRLEHLIPATRTDRRYLRRLVFGLGLGSHDVSTLTWPSTERDWWSDSTHRALTLWYQGFSRVAQDLRHHRAAFDPLLALAFAAGWSTGMWRLFRMGGRRRDRLGSLARTVAAAGGPKS